MPETPEVKPVAVRVTVPLGAQKPPVAGIVPAVGVPVQGTGGVHV